MTEEKTTALAVTQEVSPEDLALMLNAESKVDMAEQQDLQESIGLGKITVKTYTEGTVMECLIIDQHRANGYWPKGFAGGGDPPDCNAPLGTHGTGTINGKPVVNQECSGCPMNQWGSDPKGGKGKACQNKRMVYVLRKVDGVWNPFSEAIVVPASCLKVVAQYLRDTMGTPRWTFVTNVSVVGTKTASNGFAFSRGEAVPAALLPKLATVVKMYQGKRIETMQGEGGSSESTDQRLAAGHAEEEI
jgi:hypothetical protein